MNQQNSNSHNPYQLAGELDSAGVFRSSSLSRLNAFSCACCRLIWEELPQMAKEALEVAEKYVNGEVTTDEIRAERVKLWQDLGAEFREFESKKNNAYRALLCALHERDPENGIFEDYDTVCYAMQFCNKVKKTPEDIHYKLMQSIWASTKYKLKATNNHPGSFLCSILLLGCSSCRPCA